MVWRMGRIWVAKSESDPEVRVGGWDGNVAASRKKAGKAPAKNSGASLPRVPVPPVGRGWEQFHSHSQSTRFE